MIHTTIPVIVLVEKDGGVTLAERQQWAAAMTADLLGNFGPLWNLQAAVRAETPEAPLQDDEWPHYLHDQPTATDPSGALAYHDRLPDGRPALYTFVGLSRQSGDEPSQSADHENKEALVDELLTEAVQDRMDGKFWAKEVCDPCEQTGYQLLGVWLSDFVTQEWFTPSQRGGDRFNYLNTITASGQILDGGYAQKFDPSQGWISLGQRRTYRARLHELGLSRGSRRARGRV